MLRPTHALSDRTHRGDVSSSGPVISFTVPATSEQRAAGRQAVRRIVRLQGLVRLEGTALVVEWSGAVEWTQVRGPEVVAKSETVAATRREIPVDRLVDVLVRGWWRPRLEVRTADLAALEGVPTAEHGRLTLRIPRRERQAAQALVANLKDEMADAALRAAERE
jgi:hypothetical protein